MKSEVEAQLRWTHRGIIIFSVVNGKLAFKVIKKIERMSGIFDLT